MQRPDETLFGNTFPADKRPEGTRKTQQTIYFSVKDFQKVLCLQNVDIQDLDIWFRNFAKWTLVANALVDDGNLHSEVMDQRKQLCAKAGVPMRQWTPASLVTYTNALAKLYKQTAPTVGIIPSSEKQFPQYCPFINACVTRHQQCQPLKEAAAPVPLLTDAEMEVAFDKTNWLNLLESQRMNLLQMSFILGQRPEALVRLRVGSFSTGTGANGRRFIELVQGTMKNLQGDQKNVSKPLHKQKILEHTNPKLCGVAAYDRQVKLLGENPDPASFLFRGINVNMKTVPEKQMAYATCRGVSHWLRTIVNRKLTFKDCARRVVFTKLANSNAVSSHDAAKAMGVRPRTIDRYHVAGADVRDRAAEILAEVLV